MTIQLPALRELGDAVFGIGTIEALELLFRRSEVVRSLREQLEDGILLEEDLLRFGWHLRDSVTPNEHFTDEVALAAVLFLAETHPGQSLRAFVAELASNPRIEFPMASRFARRLVSRRVLLDASSEARFASTSQRLGDVGQTFALPYSSAINVGAPEQRLAQSNPELRVDLLRGGGKSSE